MVSEDGSEATAFDGYVEALIEVIGDADRAEPLRDYCTGLMMPVARKSVEPLAAVTAPSRVSAKHQSLLHFVGQAPWSDEALMARVRDWGLPRMIERGGPITAWIIDDTGFPKKGKHSVGVARQYCGQLGKQDNCQVAVSLTIANEGASLPVAWRLYLPESWANNSERREKAKIPDEIVFQTKPQIALEQIRATLSTQTPAGVILADAGYGADGGFREGLTEQGLVYSVGVQPTLSVWRPGEGPLPPKAWNGKGRPPKLMRRTADHQPLSPKPLRKVCRPTRGRPSRGVKAATSNLHPALLPCICVSRPEITICTIRAPKNGYWSNGLRATRNRSNTGFQPCRR